MKGVNVFSTNIPKRNFGSAGIEYFGKGKFNVAISLTDGTYITTYNPEKVCDCRKLYNVPLCSFSEIKDDGCYVMSNNANNGLLDSKRWKLDSSGKEFAVAGKRGRLDPNVATVALIIQELRLYADYLKDGNNSDMMYKGMESSEIFKEIFEKPEKYEYAWDMALKLMGKYREECGYVSRMIEQVISGKNFNVSEESAAAFKKMFSF